MNFLEYKYNTNNIDIDTNFLTKYDEQSNQLDKYFICSKKISDIMAVFLYFCG